MRPLITGPRSTSGSGTEQGQEKSDLRGRSDQSLSQHGSSKSLPSESQRWAHLGVLANVDDVHEEVPQKW